MAKSKLDKGFNQIAGLFFLGTLGVVAGIGGVHLGKTARSEAHAQRNSQAPVLGYSDDMRHLDTNSSSVSSEDTPYEAGIQESTPAVEPAPVSTAVEPAPELLTTAEQFRQSVVDSSDDAETRLILSSLDPEFLYYDLRPKLCKAVYEENLSVDLLHDFAFEKFNDAGNSLNISENLTNALFDATLKPGGCS